MSDQSEQNTILKLLMENEKRLDRIEIKEVPMFNYGAANPIVWPVGVPFFRTDLGWWIFNDGTRWLTVHEYAVSLTPFGLNPLPFAGAGPATILLAPIRSDYQAWYTHSDYYIFVNTTNNGTNYWALTFSDSGGTTFWAPSTIAAAVGQSTGDTVQAVAGSVAATYIALSLTKVGAPGTVGALNFTSYHRLIVP